MNMATNKPHQPQTEKQKLVCKERFTSCGLWSNLALEGVTWGVLSTNPLSDLLICTMEAIALWVECFLLRSPRASPNLWPTCDIGYKFDQQSLYKQSRASHFIEILPRKQLCQVSNTDDFNQYRFLESINFQYFWIMILNIFEKWKFYPK